MARLFLRLTLFFDLGRLIFLLAFLFLFPLRFGRLFFDLSFAFASGCHYLIMRVSGPTVREGVDIRPPSRSGY
jgi:hypothetical protein